jgi:hypothetical protein
MNGHRIRSRGPITQCSNIPCKVWLLLDSRFNSPNKAR